MTAKEDSMADLIVIGVGFSPWLELVFPGETGSPETSGDGREGAYWR